MTRPDLVNGSLMPSIYDDVFKHLAHASEDYTGDVESVGWTVTRFTVTPEDIRHAVSVTGNPRASMAGAVEPGHYLALIDDQGLIWAFFYQNNVDLLNEDFAEAAELYERLEGWTDDILVDLDENGNEIPLDECPHEDCGYGECSWLQGGVNGACDVHGNNEGHCQIGRGE